MARRTAGEFQKKKSRTDLTAWAAPARLRYRKSNTGDVKLHFTGVLIITPLWRVYVESDQSSAVWNQR